MIINHFIKLLYLDFDLSSLFYYLLPSYQVEMRQITYEKQIKTNFKIYNI